MRIMMIFSLCLLQREIKRDSCRAGNLLSEESYYYCAAGFQSLLRKHSFRLFVDVLKWSTKLSIFEEWRSFGVDWMS